MSHEVSIHEAQTSILRELLFRPSAGFAELQKPTGLSSDNFTFHIKRLVELGLIEKAGAGQYRLSTTGKEYANRLDTDNNTVERQPKVAVLLTVQREHNGRTEFIFQERLKHPYYGFWGRPTGKLRWGETIVDGAARELLEETGLTADYEIKGVYHEHVFEKESGRLLEDKVFFNVLCRNVRGELKEQFEGGRNAWMTWEEVMGQEKVFANFDIGKDILNAGQVFIEKSREYTREVF